MFSFSVRHNTNSVVNIFLKKLGVYVKPELIDAELEKHPNYPSLLSISDILNIFNIENYAYRINYENLDQDICPFIANLTNGDFVVVNDINKQGFIVSNERHKDQKVSNEDFRKIFNGIVLSVGSFVPQKFKSKFIGVLQSLKSLAVVFCIAILLIIGITFHSNYISNFNFKVLLLTIIKTLGLITSVLLLIQSIDNNNHGVRWVFFIIQAHG